MPRVRRRRHRRADPPGAGRDDLRIQAGRRREVQPDHWSGRRSVSGDAGRVRPDRSHSRQIHRRHPDPEPASRDDQPQGTAGIGRVYALNLPTHDRHGQDDSRRAVRERSVHHAAPAHRRVHRRRQIGQRERDGEQHPVPVDAGRRPVHHDRPEAPGARDVRRHPAPAHAGRRRYQAGRERAAMGGPGDGGALQVARRPRRPQHRTVQPQRSRGAGRAGRRESAGRQRAQDAALCRRHHRRARRPDDGREQGSRGVDRAAGADGTRGRHPFDPGHAASVGRRHHRAHQGQPAGPARVPRRVARRLADHSRQQRRGAAPRQGRHALSAARVVALRARARAVHLRAGDGQALQFPAQAGQAGVRHVDYRPRKKGPRSSSSRKTSCTTKRRASSWAAASRRFRTCSAGCASGSAGPRG